MTTNPTPFIKQIRIWFMDKFQNYPFWRVVYPDGTMSRPLYISEARGLAEVYQGKLIIDFQKGKKWIESLNQN